MLRIKYDDMVNEFKRILVSRGFTEKNAVDAATVFAQNSLDGIYSHGINRFPRVVEYLDKGEINPSVLPVLDRSSGSAGTVPEPVAGNSGNDLPGSVLRSKRLRFKVKEIIHKVITRKWAVAY